MGRTIIGLVTAMWLCAAPSAAQGNEDETALAALLQDFLARAGDRAAHERFWSPDLVYTSSSGTRFGKADILAGFDAEEPEEGEEVPVRYTGEEVDIRLYDDVAVVAFRLVGTPGDGSEPSHYFNTGTFLKRNGEWRVIAWQATKIPAK